MGRCGGCEAGWTDEDGSGCSCPVYGPKTLGDELPELVSAYFSALGDWREGLIDAADFLAWIDPSGALEAEQADDAEEHLRLYLRERFLGPCDLCHGTGMVGQRFASEDDLQYSEECDGCDHGLDIVRCAPRVIAGNGRRRTVVVCVCCGGPTDERATDCSYCQIAFRRITPDLVADLQASLAALAGGAHNDQRATAAE
jgi:hypothetical protein